MDTTDLSIKLELEQAHNFLDKNEIARVDPENLMILSLMGRIELLVQKIAEPEQQA